MLNKNAKWLLWGSLALCCGCVDNAYDLNKDIVMDVTIAGNKITLPVGDVKPIVLDSLIDVDDIDLLEKMENEVYALKKSDAIDPIDIEIDPIKINIDPVTHSSTFQFDEVTIEEAVLNEVVKEQEFKVNNVSIDDLNESLPTLTTSVPQNLYTPEMEEQIKSLGSSDVISIPLDGTYSTEEQEVGFNFDYTLPKEIKEITDITLNNLIQFKVSNPKTLNDVKKTISFTATFPEGFVLRTDENAPEADKYTIPISNQIKVDGIDAQGETTVLQFYIESLNGLENRDGKISFNDKIEYQVDYKLEGNFEASAATNLDDLEFRVTMDHKVSFEDAKGSTNDIDVSFEQMDFDFSAHFDNLEHIDSVLYIDFDASNSKIYFTTNLGDGVGGFEPFNLKEGCQLKLSFPENFVLDLDQCVYPKEAATYNKDEHAFFISDVNKLHGFQWELAIDRIDVYTDVDSVKHSCDLDDATASISVVSQDGLLQLGATSVESFNSTLQKLQSKNVVFTMEETHLHIDEAVVLTEVIHEDIEEHTSFSVNEKIDDGVKQIESIGFYKDVPIALEVDLTGVEDLNTIVHLDLDVTLPSFLVLDSKDSRVNLHDGKMTIKADYNPQSGKLEIGLLAKEILFAGEEFPEGMLLKDSIGSYYLDYSADVPIIGEAYIDETEMHSTILGKDIGIHVNFNIGEMEVKKFSGIYCGEIDDIQESIDFDLGEDLDFLKDEGNTVTLSDPQIEFTIDNPVSIPVDLALSLFGKDDNGNVIETSRVNAAIRLEPADYDEATGEVTAREFKYLLTNKPTPKAGYENVVIPDLSNLLKRIPNSLDIELVPTIDESMTHHVDLSKDLVLHPTYDVVVPVKFDNVHIEYTELVEDLNKDLGEALEHFANITVKADMNIRNTVPVGLTLTVEPLDAYGNIIEGVEIEDVQIAAGAGEDINGTDASENQGEKLQLVINSKGDVLRKLDKLNLIVKGDADETVGGVAFTSKQGVHITDIVVEVTGDVETNLDEL